MLMHCLRFLPGDKVDKPPVACPRLQAGLCAVTCLKRAGLVEKLTSWGLSSAAVEVDPLKCGRCGCQLHALSVSAEVWLKTKKSMGTGDYICVTVRGGAPWGFTLREGEGDTYRPFLISQVEEGGHAFLAGVQEGDEVVSLNGEPCADLSLLRAFALIDTSIDCLQLLLKRFCPMSSRDLESEETYCSERESSGDGLASTTLHIISPKHRSQSPTELYISASQDEAHYGEMDSIMTLPRGPHQLCTQLHAPPPDQRGRESDFKENEEQRCFSPGEMVELQVSLSEQRLDDTSCTSLGSAHGIEGELSNREAVETHSIPLSGREPLGQHGVVLSHPSMLGQVEVILQQPSASGAGRGILSVGGPRVSGSVGSQSEGEEGGGPNEGLPGSFTVSFGIPTGEATPAVEEHSDSEGDQDKPNKHRARHSRLRRSESLSDKQVKEAKSKCKRIALLLTAAPPNPNNKGVLMFKKHRQRAKKFTLVSYGTGEDERENSDEEDEENDDNGQETHTVEFTLVAPKGTEIDKHFLTNAHSREGVLTINWDKGLLEIERNLNNQSEMECLPDTKGKGALMFAQRRQRMDEIAAEHEELRRHGIPVEGVQETEKKTVEQSYMQSATEGHVYMDVTTHQQSQQQQYQQYQEQQYYEQQPSYQQPQQSYQHQQQNYQQQQQQYEQQYQQQQYEQQHYQQQMYQQQQGYHQEQQHMKHYSTNINGTVQHQTSESSFTNRTAKPFSVGNVMASPYSPAMSGTNQDSVGQEQIASRDERISTPAIRTGVLQDTRRKNTGKPMFTFKDAPKVSPNPALLNLLNRPGKKLGFESGPEEDYLSLGAEACNFLQSPCVKHKTPPPVAPKPMINPNSPPWSSQMEMNNQDTAQHAENSVSTPAVAPTTDATPAPELEPTPAPAPKPSPPPAPQEAPASITTEEQHTWTLPEAESQEQSMQVTAQEENSRINSTLQSEQGAGTTWAVTQSQSQQPSTTSWNPAKMQPRESPPNQTPPQEHWVTQQTTQVQPHSSAATWTPASQPSWSQPQEQAQIHIHGQPHWAQPVEQPQPEPPVQSHQTQPVEQPQSKPQVQPRWAQPVEQPQSQTQIQPPWAHSHEQPRVQQMQLSWGQPQEPVQQQAQAPWAQPLGKQSLHQPSWQSPQQNPQEQPTWVRQVQPESQPQPPWAQQPQQHAPQQAWPQAQSPEQPQPPWVSAQPQHSQQRNAWPPSQAQPETQPSWMQATQAQAQVQTQANLNPWAPVTTQSQSQPSWTQHPPEQSQNTMPSWAQEQNQPPWAQRVPPQSSPQPNTVWPPAQSQPQTIVNAWTPESKQTPVHVSTSMVNDRPSPKPWHPPQNPTQNRTPPPPPQRMHSFTTGQRASSLINPMATTLNPSSAGPAYEMPVVRGKGAEMFAKRQSRMEKFVVDSETVQANKATRSSSPTASLPNEWKYTPNVRAPPSRAFNPIQSPFYPPAATKQPLLGTSSSKDKKKGKDKQTPARKPLSVVDVMKHQPYQLNSSLFTFGPAEEAPKPPAPKPDCLPSNPPIENQPASYEQMAPIQPTGQFNAPYPQQDYGMPMQVMMHDGQYQQNPANIYAPDNTFQQHPDSFYQQAYNQQYQHPAPPAYHPQSPQSSIPAYQQASQVPYQPASSPPYLAAPSVIYQQQPPSSYVAPSFLVAARPESASGSNTVNAPKPRFTAKKSSAQVWKPTTVDKE
ncbi:synaptopodin-2-like isoform X1 [Solea senegalensis]|uniref:Synaptopodin-2-like isoform X1 n=2 Tax=Solea senegalensis TaxID=28829 RepID=A0AAV6QSI5_SOLSE|nr:synaptopodin-2-like isoform X1 [Solea senegalensis]